MPNPAPAMFATCLRCGNDFGTKPSKQAKYCGRACSVAAAAAVLVTKPCAMCGEDFTAAPKRQYCSRACSDKRNKTASLVGQQRAAYVSRPCDGCGIIVSRRAATMTGKVYCSRGCVARNRPAGPERPVALQVGDTQLSGEGYVLVYLGRGAPGAYAGGYALQHRVVMAEHLGRPLLRSETPHHINGDRTDNRLENLELWSRSQPSGQRVVDKVAWARELLGLYGDAVEVERYAPLSG